MTSNDKSNVLVLKDERGRRQKQVKRKPKTKRGRPPKRNIRTFYGLVGEVEAAIDEIRKEKPRLKRKPLKEAIERCLKHDNETQPRSWWWGEDGAPLKYRSAAHLYDDALEAIEAFEAKQVPDNFDRHFAPLASLAPAPPPMPASTYEQMFAQILRDKRALYEPDYIIPPAMLLAQKRDFQRLELATIARFKDVSRKMHKALAMEAPRRPPEQVERLRVFVKKFDGQLADFEISLGKIGAAVRNFPSQK